MNFFSLHRNIDENCLLSWCMWKYRSEIRKIKCSNKIEIWEEKKFHEFRKWLYQHELTYEYRIVRRV